MNDVEKIAQITEEVNHTQSDDEVIMRMCEHIRWLLSKVSSLSLSLSQSSWRLYEQTREASRRVRYESDYVPYGDEDEDRR